MLCGQGTAAAATLPLRWRQLNWTGHLCRPLLCSLSMLARLTIRPVLHSLPSSLFRAKTTMTVLKAASENVPQCGAEPAAKMQRVEAPVEALRVRRLNEHALLPKRGSAGAAGYDLARCVGCQ